MTMTDQDQDLDITRVTISLCVAEAVQRAMRQHSARLVRTVSDELEDLVHDAMNRCELDTARIVEREIGLCAAEVVEVMGEVADGKKWAHEPSSGYDDGRAHLVTDTRLANRS